MKIKHKLLSDYQYLAPDKKIFMIKSGTIIIDYIFKLKNENIYIDREIVDANPQIFQIIDWKAELLGYMKAEKLPQPAQLSKKLVPFIEEMILTMQNPNVSAPNPETFKDMKKDSENMMRKLFEKKEEELLKDIEKRESDLKKQYERKESELLKDIEKKESDLNSLKKSLDNKESELKISEESQSKIKLLKDNLERKEIDILKEVEAKEIELKTLKINLDRLEADLISRERRIKDLENETDERVKRVEKKEDDYKLDIKVLEKKDDEVRIRSRALTEKELEIQKQIQELSERERNVDLTALTSAKDIDAKYTEMRNKINEDAEKLTKREKELESEHKKLKELESNFEKRIDELVEASKSKIYSDLEEELRGIQNDIGAIASISSELGKFNHPFILEANKQLDRIIGRLRNRIDNNLLS
jgi:chromosome segregation ATPase